MKTRFVVLAASAGVSIALGAMSSMMGCSSTSPRATFDDQADGGGVGDGGFIDPNLGDGDVPKNCTGLECQVEKCSGGGSTTLSGIVVAPTPAQYGKPDPLYNAIVYVPNADLAPFPSGVSCEKCGTVTSGTPITVTLSAADGTFKLENVPSGKNIPLVVQIGRWRRKVVIPSVNGCTDNPLPTELTRLPRDKTEGDIPLMAIATSVYDPTECIMRKIGVADSEFTAPTGNGRIHIYKGNGGQLAGTTPPMADLWANPATLKQYDIIALPCSSQPSDATGKQNIGAYADSGGRVYITDLSQDVIKTGGPAGWGNTASFTASGSYSNPAMIDTSFPKGQAMADWLKNVGATPTKGQMNLTGTYARLTTVNAPAQRWMYSSSTTQTYSFNTPVGVPDDQQCGRVFYSSFHIASGGGGTVPTSCSSGPLTPQEKALEFMLFDLSSCVQKDTATPVVPK